MVASHSSTVVEHSSHHSKVKGLLLAHTGGQKMGKQIWLLVMFVTFAMFQLYCSENSVWLDLQILYFRLQVIDKSCRQVLTPVNSSQLLLKLEILDKFRLVTFHKIQHKETATL